MPGFARPTPIEFDDSLHTAGEGIRVESFPIRQALAWWLGAELVRRHPADLRLTLEYPHQGPTLTILRRNGAHWKLFAFVALCPFCRITPNSWLVSSPAGQRFNWLEVLLTPDRREYVVKQLERAEGLPSPEATPPAVASSIGPRMIASYLARTMLAPSTRWRMEAGASSGDDGAGVDYGLFSKFPEAENDRRRRVSKASEPHSQQRVGERYWFLCRVDKADTSHPEVAIDMVGGNAWNKAGSVNLLERYKALGRKIDALASYVLPPVN